MAWGTAPAPLGCPAGLLPALQPAAATTRTPPPAAEHDVGQRAQDAGGHRRLHLARGGALPRRRGVRHGEGGCVELRRDAVLHAGGAVPLHGCRPPSQVGGAAGAAGGTPARPVAAACCAGCPVSQLPALSRLLLLCRASPRTPLLSSKPPHAGPAPPALPRPPQAEEDPGPGARRRGRRRVQAAPRRVPRLRGAAAPHLLHRPRPAPRPRRHHGRRLVPPVPARPVQAGGGAAAGAAGDGGDHTHTGGGWGG